MRRLLCICEREMNLWIKEKCSLSMNLRRIFFKKQFFDLKNIFLMFMFRKHFSLFQRLISLRDRLRAVVSNKGGSVE